MPHLWQLPRDRHVLWAALQRRRPTARRAAVQGVVVFDIDGEKWTLDLRPGSRKVTKGAPEGKPDLTLTISDENFVKLVMGKMGPQQVRALQHLASACIHRWKCAEATWHAAFLPLREVLIPGCSHVGDWAAGIPDAQAQDWRQHGARSEAPAYPGRSRAPCQALDI